MTGAIEPVITYDLKFIIGFWAVAESHNMISNVPETIGTKAHQYPPGKLFESRLLLFCELNGMFPSLLLRPNKIQVSYHRKCELLDGFGQSDRKPLEEQGKVYYGSDAEEGGCLSCARHD
jgi:hypothetical protein